MKLHATNTLWVLLSTGVILATAWTVAPSLADDFTKEGGQSTGLPQKDPDKQPPQHCDSKGGEPVFLDSGAYGLSATDISIPSRGLPIIIRRTYRSSSAYNSRLGYGWDLSVNMKIRELADGNALLLDGANRKVQYTLDGSDYTSPPGRYDTLVKNPDGTFTLTDKHQGRHEFDVNGNLTAIVDRNGNSLTFSYDPGGTNGLFDIIGPSEYFVNQTRGLVARDFKLTTITDATGRDVTFSYNADGLLSAITDFAGRTWTYDYDPNTNDLLTVTNPATPEHPAGTTTTYTYEDHRLTSITDGKGQQWLVNQYDPDGRVYEQTFGADLLAYSYDMPNKQATYTDGRGIVTQVTHNDAGNPIEEVIFTQGLRPTDPPSYTTTNEYNEDMERTRTVHPRGNEELMAYDDLGNLTSRTLAAAPGFSDPDIVTTYTYHSTFNFVQTVTDPRGNVTTYAYDPNNGNLLSVTQPEVGGETPVWQFTYNAFGQRETETDPEGLVTKYDYDPATGYLTRVTRNFGGVPEEITQFAYDAVGNVTSVTDANGNTTTFVYNDQNQLTQIISPSPFNYVTNYGYDANGNVIQIDRQMDGGDGFQTTTFTYTIKDELETVTNELGHVTSYTYDANGNLTSVTDAELNPTSHDYDERNLLWKITDALTYVTEFAYDHNGNFASLTDANTNTTTFAYDGFDRLETTTYPDSSTEVHTYDPAGNLTQFLNRRTQAIAFVYDELNRLQTMTRPDTGAITYAYDLVGRLETLTDPAGVLQRQYDVLGRLQQVTDVNNHTVAYEYDTAGNRTKLTYPDGFYVRYHYDELDRLSRIKPLPEGGYADFDFDEDSDIDAQDFTVFAGCISGPEVPHGGAPNCLRADSDTDGDVDLADFRAFQIAATGSDPPGSALVVYSYDSLSRRISAANQNGTSVSYDYDDASRLTSLVNQLLPDNLSFAYTHDNVGNRLTMTVNGTDTHIYGYDDTYQLTSVDYPDGFFQPDTTYNYDPLGNRTSVVDGGTTTYVPNNLNQYDTVGGVSYSYDSSGNLTSDGANTYAYDSVNRLVAATVPPSTTATYEYDAMGRRTTKTVDGLTTRFVYDGWRVIAEYDGSDQILHRFIYGTGIDEPLRMDAATAPGESTFDAYHYHSDGLCSVIALTNDAGQIAERYAYDAYGKPDSTSSAGNPYLFTGRRHDLATGWYYYRFRQYSSHLGRFVMADPIGYWGGVNPYSYVGNAPATWADPLGLARCDADDTQDIVEQIRDSWDWRLHAEPSSEGGYDYKYTGDTFELSGYGPISGGDFGNYLAGYMGQYHLGGFGAIGAFAAGHFYGPIDYVAWRVGTGQWPRHMHFWDSPRSQYLIRLGVDDAKRARAEQRWPRVDREEH